MNFKKFDNKLVRIITIDDEVFEGYCSHSNIEFNECEFGINAETLDIENFKFKKDDIKTLAICRLILSEDPNNEKIKELHDLIYEDVKDNYYENGELEKPNEEKMDKHMKLNKDGEYEYCFSDESEEEGD